MLSLMNRLSTGLQVSSMNSATPANLQIILSR